MLGLLFKLFAIFIVVAIVGYFLTVFLNLLPLPHGANTSLYNPIKQIYVTVFGLFNSSFLLIVFVALIADLAYSYMYPSINKAIGNIIFLFAIVFVWLVFNHFLPTLNTALDAKTIMPSMYAFFSNYYGILLIFFGTILSIIFNVNGHHREERKEGEEYDEYRRNYPTLPYN